MNNTSSTSGEVIDLAALTKPAQRVVGIFDRLAQGETPSPGSLDEALEALDQAPRPSGPLGDDIALLVCGGDGHTRGEIVAAVERLRRVTTVKAAPPNSTRSKPRPRRKRQKPKPQTRQLHLPGMADGGKDAS